ncbi:MAG: hypothetical protein V3T82_08035 [Nitrospinaceae bacterium]
MNTRDRIGFAIKKAMDSGAPEPDYDDAREIDRLADAVMEEFEDEIAQFSEKAEQVKS